MTNREKLIEWSSDWLVRRPILALLITLTFVAATGYGMLSLESRYGFKHWFKPNDPALLAYEEYEREFGNDDSIVIAVHSPSGIFDKDSVALVQELTEKMWMVKEVIRVESLANYSLITGESGDIVIDPVFKSDDPEFLKTRVEQVKKNDNIINYIISEDLKTTLVTAHLNPLYDAADQYGVPVTQAKKLLESFKGKGDHIFYMTGSAALTEAYREVSENDFMMLLPLVVGLTMFLLLYIFRSFSLSILITVLYAVAIVSTLGIAGWLKITLNPLTVCLPQILIAITLADSIHLVQGFARLRAEGLSKFDAAKSSFVTNLFPTLMTSVTTGLGFVAFVASDVSTISDLGIMATIGVMIAWFITAGILPAAFIYFPFPVRPRKESKKRQHAQWITSYIGWVSRHKIKIMLAWGGLAALSFYVGSFNTIDSDPLNYYAEGVPIKVANDFMRDQFGGSRGVELVLDSGKADGIKEPEYLKKVVEFQAWISEIPGVAKVTSVADIVGELHQAMEGKPLPKNDRLPDSREAVAQQLFLYSMSLPAGMGVNHWSTMDFKKMRIKILWTVEDSEETLANINKIEDKAKEMGLTMTAAGKASLVPELSHHILSTFSEASTRALVMILLTMALICRSLRLGTLAMIPNAIPGIFGGLVMFLMGYKYDVGSILVMSVVMGISVDDTVHFMVHFQEKVAQGKSYVDSIVAVFHETGEALLMSTAVLSIGFGVAILSDFTPFSNFGMMISISLVFALVADFMLLPAMLMTPGIGTKFVKKKKVP